MRASPAGLRRLPWAAILAIAKIVWERFRDDVEPGDRSRLGAIVRKSRGNPWRLTEKERHDLLRILGHVDRTRLARDVAGAASLRRAGRFLRR